MTKKIENIIKKSLILIICIALFMSLVPINLTQTANATGQTIYFFKCYDLVGYTDPETGNSSTALGMTDYLALKLLQGVVNRTEHRFLIDQKFNYYADSDIQWKAYYESKGYTFVTLNSMKDVYNTFKSYFNGVITYNHTFNTDTWHWPEAEMAIVLGALTDRIPILSSRVTEFQNNYGLSPANKLVLTDSFTDYPDASSTITGRLESLGWTTALQAYQWGCDNLLKYCNPHQFHLLCDESLDQTGEDKIFHTHLRSTNTNEFNLLKTIYAYYDERNVTFPVWGWVSQEDIDTDAMAPYGGYIQTSGSTNMSFHDKFTSEQQNFTQNTHYTTENTTLENKYYITFMASEPNTPKAITTFQHGAWLDSNRGNVPINWGVAPAMSEKLPYLTEYYYDTATPNDYFYMGECTPIGFADYDEMPQAAREYIKTKGAQLMQKVDQRYMDIYSAYGAMGQFDKNLYGDLANSIGAQAILATTPSGADTETWNGAFVLNRPEIYPLRQTDLSDDFSSSTGKWITESGTWGIQSSKYSQSSTAATQRSTYATNSLHSYINAQTTMKKVSGTNGSAGISFRKGTGANYYWFYLKDGNKAGLMKVVNGVNTILGTEVDFNHNTNTEYTLKVIANGNSIKCYANNQLVINLTDDTFSTGKLGLATSSCQAQFDNVKAVWTTQEQQVANYIKSKTVDVSRAKPYFLPGYYGYIFTDEHEKNQQGSEPGAGETMIMSPTSLKEVMDILNSVYPNQYKFVRLDEMVSAAKLHYSSTIQDNLNDFTKMYRHSTSLYFDSSSTTNFGGDASRLVRNSNTEEYITYQMSAGINNFSVDSWFWPGEGETDFAFYTSADDITYTLFTPTRSTVSVGWNKVTYTGNSLPVGTKYIKIVYKHNTANYWNPQLGSVSIQGGTAIPSFGTVTDAMNDFTKIYSHSPSLYFDSSNSASLGGDSSRLVRNSNTEENVIYKAPANNITDFSCNAWFWSEEATTDLAFYISPDNITYTQFTPTKSTITGGWNNVTYNGRSLPIGTKYLKIVYKHNSINYWNPQIGSVVFDYGN